MRKVIMAGIIFCAVSTIVNAEQNKVLKIEKNIDGLALENNNVGKVENIDYDLNYNKGLLTIEENNCFIPFSSWHRSVNLYSICALPSKGNLIELSMMSLQNKIRVDYQDKSPIFYDRLKMKATINCGKPIENTKTYDWEYLNRDEKKLSKKNLNNVNWRLVNSIDQLGRKLCQEKFPETYNKTMKLYEERKEKMKLAKERNKK